MLGVSDLEEIKNARCSARVRRLPVTRGVSLGLMRRGGVQPGCGLHFCTAISSPGIAVFADPVQQSAFETDVISQPLRLDPLVSENLLPLSEKLLVKAGLLYKVSRGLGLLKR